MTLPPYASTSPISAWKTRLRLAVSSSDARWPPSSVASASVSAVNPAMSANSAAPCERSGTATPAAIAARRSLGMYASGASVGMRLNLSTLPTTVPSGGGRQSEPEGRAPAIDRVEAHAPAVGDDDLVGE